MLLLSSVQYNQTFSTTPAGNSHQYYPRSRYSREHCTRSRNYRGFHIFFNPVPAGNLRVSAGLAPYPRPCKTLVSWLLYGSNHCSDLTLSLYTEINRSSAELLYHNTGVMLRRKVLCTLEVEFYSHNIM